MDGTAPHPPAESLLPLEQTRDVTAWLAAIVNSSTDAIVSKTLDGIITTWNPAAEQLFGYTAEEAIGQSITLIIPPDRRGEFATIMKCLVRGEAISHQTTERVRKDGSRVAVFLSISPVRDATGRIVGAAKVSRDLTETLRARDQIAALIEAETRYRTLVEQLPAVVSLNAPDANHSTLYISPKSEALFGYTPDEYLADPMLWAQTVHPDDRERVLAGVARMNATGEAIQDEYRMLARDGRVVWVLEDARLVRDNDGRPLHWQTVQLDITGRKQVEQALRRSEERFRTAFDSAAIGMALVDLGGRFLQVNAELYAFMGYTEAELLTKTFHGITHPDDRATGRAQMHRLIAGEISAYQVEKRYLRKDGQVVWGHLSAALVRDEQGAPLHFIHQVEDVTAQKRTEAELKEAVDTAQAANRVKGAFLDLMSHELRTPLQAVLGYAEFLLSAPRDPLTDAQREDISTIHQAGGRMITLINQVLDLSRMEAGRIDLTSKPFDLAQVLEAVRQDIAPQARAKGVTVEIDLSPSLPHVTGDAERMRQILLNLAGNAVKFTQQGSIRITATPTSTEGVEIAVRDTGVGIPAEALPHIFEDFHQVESSHTRRHGGSGLGLAIAWKLAEQMGGSIRVSSDPGVGSIFTLYLPGES